MLPTRKLDPPKNKDGGSSSCPLAEKGNNMTEDEVHHVKAFFEKGRSERFAEMGDKEKQRSKWTDKLNHSPGLKAEHVSWLPSNADIINELKKKGAPDTCSIISNSTRLDGKKMSLEEAIKEVKQDGWGTVLICIPGKLGYYYGESGERRALLTRS